MAGTGLFGGEKVAFLFVEDGQGMISALAGMPESALATQGVVQVIDFF